MTPSLSDAAKILAGYRPLPGAYVQKSLKRFVRTLNLLPAEGGELLELGCDNHFSLLLRHFTAYTLQTHNLPGGGSGYSPICHFVDQTTNAVVEFDRVQFSLESGSYPFSNDCFQGVVCAEVIEHLLHDPMAMLYEINRILKRGGFLVLTTPNLIGWHGLLKGFKGINPLEFSCFMKDHTPPLLQHAKEYTPGEITLMLEAAGFEIEVLNTPYFLYPQERFGWADWLMLGWLALWLPLAGRHPKLLRHRGSHIFVRARKMGPVRDRHPRAIYA